MRIIEAGMFTAVAAFKGVTGFYVVDHNSDCIICYRNKKDACNYMHGHEAFVYGEACRYDERRDHVLAYLKERAKRAAQPKAQMELF